MTHLGLCTLLWVKQSLRPLQIFSWSKVLEEFIQIDCGLYFHLNVLISLLLHPPSQTHISELLYFHFRHCQDKLDTKGPWYYLEQKYYKYKIQQSSFLFLYNVVLFFFFPLEIVSLRAKTEMITRWMLKHKKRKQTFILLYILHQV